MHCVRPLTAAPSGLASVLLLAWVIGGALPGEVCAASLTGTIRYSGSRGPVSPTRPLVIDLHHARFPADGGVTGRQAVTSNGGFFAFDQPAGNYYFFYWLDLNNDGRPDPGEPFEIHNDRFAFPGDAVSLPPDGANIDFEFDDTGVLSGIAGTVTYTGTMGQPGPFNLIVSAFVDHGLEGMAAHEGVEANGGRYSILTLDRETYYLRAFFDRNGNLDFDPGEPFEIHQERGRRPGDPVVAGPDQTAVNFSFGDEHLTPPARLSGTIRYSGARGRVTAARPILVLAFEDPFAEFDSVADAAVTSNGGAFDLVVPAAGTYYLAYFFDAGGDDSPLGDPFEIYNEKFNFPADPVVAPQAGIALDFDDRALLSGIAGSVTYTGRMGPVTGRHTLRVEVFRDANLTDAFDVSDLGINGEGYDVVTVDTDPRYLRVFFDASGNRRLDPGEPLQIFDRRGAPPGDPVIPGTAPPQVHFTFGDEHLAPSATATPTRTPTPMRSATPTTALPPGPCVGDCSGDGTVTIDELVRGVNIALGSQALASCPGFDVDQGGTVTVDELIKAVNAAMTGCATS